MGLRSGDYGGHELSVLPKINLSPGRYCLRYSRVLGWNNEEPLHSVRKQLCSCQLPHPLYGWNKSIFSAWCQWIAPRIRLFVCYRLQKKLYIQGAHKVRAHFTKAVTLITFALEIICKKNLKEVNRYFRVLLKFYLSFHMFSMNSNIKSNTILQFTKNIFQLIYSYAWNHITYFSFQIFWGTRFGCMHNCFHMYP